MIMIIIITEMRRFERYQSRVNPLGFICPPRAVTTHYSSPRWWTIAPWSHHRRLVSTVTTIFVISNQLPPQPPATSLAAIFSIVNSEYILYYPARGRAGILAFQIYVSIFWFILTIRYLHSCARLNSEHAATKITHNWPKTNFCLVHMTQTPKAV